MNKLFLSIATSLLMLSLSWGQTQGNIDSQTLNEIRHSFQNQGATKGLQNAISNAKSIKSLALNRNKQGKIDHFTSYRVGVKGITDQEKSGRCWMFTSMNTLRPTVMSKFNLDHFDFSHNYSYFWDIFEKANLFLDNIIATAPKDYQDREVLNYLKSPVSDGGVWNSFYNIAQKYGVVPTSVMPETKISNNTGELVRIINRKLRGEAYKIKELARTKTSPQAINNIKIDALKAIYRILALALGEPPVKFDWRYKDSNNKVSETKTYTPLEFLKEIAPNFNNNQMVMIMNDPTREYYKVYEIKNYRNVNEGINWTYLNLPNDVIKKYAINSIKNNEAMYASCDVGKQHNRDTGIMDVGMYDYEDLFGVAFDMDKKARILTRQSGSSHAMTLIGVDVDKNGKSLKWEFENSWGEKAGNKGYLTFTDAWFDEYMFRIVVNKRYLDAKALNALKEKPTQLPVWDYMF